MSQTPTHQCSHEADIAELKTQIKHKRYEINDIEARLDSFNEKLDDLLEHLSRVELQLIETISVARTYKSIIYLLISIFGLSGVLFIIKTATILLD